MPLKASMPKATLMEPEPYLLERIWWARRAQKAPAPDSFQVIRDAVSPKELEEEFRKVIKDHLSPFFEYINMTWKLENVSRALQQQLTRHRFGFAYSITSLRVVKCEDFAGEQKYHLPATVKNRDLYIEAMFKIQEYYNRLLAAGESAQDARGILPLNIYSTITMTCNLRRFIEMINKRMCIKTQGEFQALAYLMRDEIATKWNPIILEAIGEPCRFGPCIMIPENEEQIAQGKLEGTDNTSKVCPLYIELGLHERNK